MQNHWFPAKDLLVSGKFPENSTVQNRIAVKIKCNVSGAQRVSFETSVGYIRFKRIDVSRMNRSTLRYNPFGCYAAPNFSAAMLVEVSNTPDEVDLEFKMARNPFELNLRRFWLHKYGITLPSDSCRAQVFFPYSSSSLTYPSCCLFEYEPIHLRRTQEHYIRAKLQALSGVQNALKGIRILGNLLLTNFEVKCLQPPKNINKKTWTRVSADPKSTIRIHSTITLQSFKRRRKNVVELQTEKDCIVEDCSDGKINAISNQGVLPKINIRADIEDARNKTSEAIARPVDNPKQHNKRKTNKKKKRTVRDGKSDVNKASMNKYKCCGVQYVAHNFVIVYNFLSLLLKKRSISESI
uniref:Uncharacterized protein n=1 Tax=Lotharella oceanica TaxID=641309 RepID=A0A7S2TGW3_9EUKA|mmetsp:Transcript_11791/g.22739  ORF Transcript_11791/g.22739 Transcript_11791/m.22739 type:complete len:353 (+) Transcript_11791:396-1454(+)